MSSGDEKGFKVTDRRASREDDAPEAEANSAPQTAAEHAAEAAAEATESAPEATEPAPESTGSTESHGHDHAAHGAPPADFNTLVLSLSTSALMHLGLVAGPDGKPAPKNLPLARHSIDLLAMLEEKTKGNLSGEEELLLSEVLYDLRMNFVTVSKA